MALLNRYLILFVLSVATAAGVSATPSAPRTFSVLAGAAGDWAKLDYARSPSAIIPLVLGRQVRSPEQTAASGETWEVGRAIIDPITGIPARKIVARTTWPQGVRTALFVLVPKLAPDAEGLEFDVLASDDSPTAFPPETLRVINATPANLAGRIGAEQVSLPPGVSRTFATTAFLAPDEDHDPGMPVGLAVHMPAGWVALYDAPLSVSPNTRVLVIVLPPKNAGSTRIQVRAVHQTLPPPVTGVPLVSNR
ncbi:hypothetical protein [Rariglobus hedericola]|uniref:DUF4397 domain-containing protein n=1 Tax=Rariglobus hedericola TaxID=2597822 RepID=A0A556QEG4_9BACT|nr:hypothetical protein [Rariglobus hedericola]TSJ75039.1 hypothetical protein FPL22_16710 [Rariglobus hedericola]